MTYNKMWSQLKAHIALAHTLNGATHVTIESLLRLIDEIEIKNGEKVPK